jgi:Fe2+ transport system protein FeoA
VDTTVQETQLAEHSTKLPFWDLRLADVPLQHTVELVHIDLPVDQAEPLLERGVLPGCRICPVRLSPAGDPIVSVDGSLLAIRRETADCLCVRLITQLQGTS